MKICKTHTLHQRYTIFYHTRRYKWVTKHILIYLKLCDNLRWKQLEYRRIIISRERFTWNAPCLYPQKRSHRRISHRLRALRRHFKRRGAWQRFDRQCRHAGNQYPKPCSGCDQQAKSLARRHPHKRYPKRQLPYGKYPLLGLWAIWLCKRTRHR